MAVGSIIKDEIGYGRPSEGTPRHPIGRGGLFGYVVDSISTFIYNNIYYINFEQEKLLIPNSLILKDLYTRVLRLRTSHPGVLPTEVHTPNWPNMMIPKGL